MKKILIILALLLNINKISAQTIIPAYVPTNSLVGWWPFNGNANDLTGIMYGSTINGATLTADRYGNTNNAYSFNGLTDYINCGSSFNSGQNKFTWSVWCYLSPGVYWSGYGGGGIINKGYYPSQSATSFAPEGYDLYYKSSSGLSVKIGPTQAGLTITTNTLNLFNQWSHIVHSCNGNMLRLYYNGNKIDSLPVSGVGVGFNPPTLFGARNINNGNTSQIGDFFSGKLDDIGFWGRALSDCEIKKLYTSETFSISASASNTICFGQSLNLTATGGNTYSWSTGSIGQSISVSPTANIVYTVSTNYFAGCLDSRTFSITVNPCANLNETAFSTNSLHIFPNPTKDQINIIINNNILIGKKYIITNTLGQQVATGFFNNQITKIEIQHLSEGSYQIHINDFQENYKFIKE
jgi:hypothetical protein